MRSTMSEVDSPRGAATASSTWCLGAPTGLCAAARGASYPGPRLHVMRACVVDHGSYRPCGDCIRAIQRGRVVRAAAVRIVPKGLTAPRAVARLRRRARHSRRLVRLRSSPRPAGPAADLGWPATCTSKAAIQHRGWFQSALLVGLATRGRPPFREVLTHGFLIDLEAARCPSRSATWSRRRTSSRSGAEIIGSGCDDGVHRGAASRKRFRTRVIDPTVSCATRAASWWRTCTTSTRQPTWCLSPGSTRSIGMRSRGTRRRPTA